MAVLSGGKSLTVAAIVDALLKMPIYSGRDRSSFYTQVYGPLKAKPKFMQLNKKWSLNSEGAAENSAGNAGSSAEKKVLRKKKRKKSGKRAGKAAVRKRKATKEK